MWSFDEPLNLPVAAVSTNVGDSAWATAEITALIAMIATNASPRTFRFFFILRVLLFACRFLRGNFLRSVQALDIYSDRTAQVKGIATRIRFKLPPRSVGISLERIGCPAFVYAESRNAHFSSQKGCRRGSNCVQTHGPLDT